MVQVIKGRVQQPSSIGSGSRNRGRGRSHNYNRPFLALQRFFQETRLSRLLIGFSISILALFQIYKLSHLALTSALASSKPLKPSWYKSKSNTIDDLDRNILSDILEARVFLVDISIPGSALSPKLNTVLHKYKKNITHEEDSEDGSRKEQQQQQQQRDYGNTIQAYFCPLDWDIHKKDPSGTPMFKDLLTKSGPKCSRSQYLKVKFKDIVMAAQRFDATSRGVKSIPPNAFVFHETRCGSTLIANLLAAFDPSSNRVYSESPPPVTAMKACKQKSKHDCDPNLASQVLRDVVYLMGRTNRVLEETRVFYKIQSVGVQSISVLTQAFPNTPWFFAYRDSVQVMMSHMKNDFVSGQAVCLRAKSNPPQLLKDLVVEESNHQQTVQSISNEEFCAAHLASLCQSALQERNQPQTQQQQLSPPVTGQFINYKSLPDILWNTVLPEYLDIEATEQYIENMKVTSGMYSKGRGEKANQEWKEDSIQKDERAPPEVQAAADIFLRPSFEAMEKLALSST